MSSLTRCGRKTTASLAEKEGLSHKSKNFHFLGVKPVKFKKKSDFDLDSKFCSIVAILIPYINNYTDIAIC